MPNLESIPDLESLKRSILSECEEDHVGLWSVIKDAREALPGQDEVAFREHVLAMLQELLTAHEIVAGFPLDDGRFRSLRLTPEKVMTQVRSDWPIDHRPTIGEGVWFTRSKKANRATPPK